MTMAMRSSSWLSQRQRSRTLRCKSAKNDSIAALSPAEPTWPIEPTIRWRVSARCTFRERNWLPRSECRMQPATSPRRATAISMAATTSRAFIRRSMDHPRIRFDQASLMAHRYSFPSPVGCSDQPAEALTVATRHRKLVDLATPHPQSHWQVWRVERWTRKPIARDRERGLPALWGCGIGPSYGCRGYGGAGVMAPYRRVRAPRRPGVAYVALPREASALGPVPGR